VPTLLDTIAAIVLTYAAHSAAACAVALGLARLIRRPHDRDILWKAALVAPIATATTATFASNLGLRTLVDLAELLRRGSHLSLPHRKVMIHVTTDGATETVVRQFTDPVTTALTTFAVVVAIVAIIVAFIRFVLRRRALSNALRGREHVADVESAGGSTIRLSATDGLQSPVAFGGNEICLPAEVLTDFSDRHKQSLIAHETAHLERRDPPWFFAVELITALSAFQPLVFIVARSFRRDVELICDEAAVTRTGDRSAMIGALARLAAPFDPSSALHAATAYDGSPLVQRAERIATLPSRETSSHRRGWWVITVALVAATPLAIPVLSSAPRIADFPKNLPLFARDTHSSGRLVRVDSMSIGSERMVRRTIVRLN
jgi:beta-lactamase regulating signal transducer with metallopeptidase domain